MRILLVADTHIGFDLPRRPRVTRRRRGHDFLTNFRRALEPALAGEVDLVVHGGDLLYRSIVLPGIVEIAMLPRTFRHSVGNRSIAISGFPFLRDIRARFASVVEETGRRSVDADTAVLCIHQAVEGARVGLANHGSFTFRDADDVVRGLDIPEGFSAILSGYIHRAQVLWSNLDGVRLTAPVIYPGSVERTSWAERDEEKVYAIVTAGDPGASTRDMCTVEWVPLNARPMIDLTIALRRLAPATMNISVHASQDHTNISSSSGDMPTNTANTTRVRSLTT